MNTPSRKKGLEQTYRLITDLMDITTFPALLLAQEYQPYPTGGYAHGLPRTTSQQRWELENTLDEFKTHLNARKTPILTEGQKNVPSTQGGWFKKSMVGF